MAHWDSKLVVDAIAEIEDEKFVLPVIQRSWNIRSCGNFLTHFFCLNRKSQICCILFTLLYFNGVCGTRIISGGHDLCQSC